MTRCLKPLAALSAALTLSACTVLPESQPPRIVDLAVNGEHPVYDRPRPESLRVDLPRASAPFDSNLVLIQPSRWEFQALPDTRWRTDLPMLVHDQLVQSLRETKGFNNVLTTNSAANADISILSELRGFHARKTAGSTRVVIQLYYELLNNRSRETLCVLDEKQVVSAENSDLANLMAAFSQGISRVATNTARWAFSCLEKHNPG